MKGVTSSSNRGQQITEKQPPHGKFQPTAEQVRYAQLLSTKEEPGWLKQKIQEVVDLTQKPQDEVAIALYDCDNNVDAAVNNLLEGKYNQGEWTTFSSNRKKKSQPADILSSLGPKDKSITSRQDKKDRDGNSSLSQSVENNNRRNKGQMDRISDGTNDRSRQNGPLNNTRPPGGGRNRNRDDRDDRRGDQDDRRGDREDRRGDRDNRRSGDRGDSEGDRRNRNDYRDRDRNDRGGRGGRGDRWDRGDRGERIDKGDKDERGDRSGDNRGDQGDKRFGGRGGFNRRGGMGRGGRGGRGTPRGGRFPNNRSGGGRRSDQMNGPTKDTELPSTNENWDNSPVKDEKDWALSEPAGTTEDWGDEEWGSEKQNDTSNMPSWATTDKKSTWENDSPTNQDLTNHVNHLPECDDEAILSSKVASNVPPLIPNHEDPVRFSTASTVSSQPYDTSKSFGLTEVSPPKDIAALANAGLAKMANHPSRVTPSQEPAVIMAADSGQPQPQRQQKSRTKRIPKGGQIPKQAVEMPGNNGGMDSLDVQFGNLDFGGELMTGPKPEEVRVIQQKEEQMPQQKPILTAGNTPNTPQPAAVATTIPSQAPKPVPMATTSMSSESSVVNAYDEMSPRHYAPPGTPVSKSAMTQVTPEPSPRKDKVELREPKTPPMTKKVDVSTSPMPLTTTMTASMAKSNNEGVANRATSLHSQIEAIATSDDRLDERVHQQAPAIGHSTSTHADHNAMRSRLGVSSSAATRPNPTPAGVSLSGAGPPPGIISGIQPAPTGPTRTTSSNVNRQTAHGTKPPTLPPGVVPLYGMQPAPGFPGFSPLAYPLDDMQMIQRMQMPPYYDIPFPVAGRESVQNSYSGTDVKYNRNDTSSPVPSTLTAGPHAAQQAPFINTHAQLHPFGYAGNLAFYHGGGMIGGFAAPYTTQMFPLPAKGPGVTTQFQQNFGNQLGPHYTSGYDGLANTHDFGKQGYQHSAQSKANAVSGTTASNSPSDLSTAYKPQFADKGYLSGTPPPLNISLPGQAHQPHPAGFPLMPVLAPTQHPPSLFQSHHLSHQQQLDNLNPNRAAPNQGKVTQNKSHHGQSIYPQPFWSGTN